MVGFGRRFGSWRLVRVESLFTKVPGSTVLVGFGLFWCVFWVAAVGLGRIFAYVGAGLDGFGRFWSVLVCILGRGGWFGSNLYIRRCRVGRFWSVLVGRGGQFGSNLHIRRCRVGWF